MRWADVNLDVSEWNYVPAKIDSAEPAPRVPHLVPLATQAVAVLRELYPLTGRWEYFFPGARDKKKPMSDGAVNNALRNAGYSTREEHTGHGLRAMARTILHEGLGYAPEVIEHQLAHRVPDSFGTAYNRTKFLVERPKMMQQWADYLDQLRETVEEAASVDATAA
jgi:integrase